MSSTLDRLASTLGDRYEIEREIGQGGMASVYLATDVRHHRKVAIKVLLPELSAVLGPDRFLKEIELTANLQHPNILPLFDSGVADGLLYYVMPYVEGESLRGRLTRERQLAIPDAVRIATETASALEYAHKRGIVHRDIKPENILLQEGRPIVADFGIALAVSMAAANRITQTGMSLGTPQYMSPEQATGEREIDARSDIYSLGAVTYEMLTGDPPHTGSSAQAVIAKVITEKPTPIRTVRNSVPLHVDHAVQRALAKVPADRWSSAAQFIDALEGRLTMMDAAMVNARRAVWLPWAITALAVAALALVLLRRQPAADQPLVRFTIGNIRGDRGNIEKAAISPDGQTIAITSRTGDSTTLWVRRLDELSAHRVDGGDGATEPFFSPDGKYIAFLSIDGKLRKIAVSGGDAAVIAPLTNPVGLTWATPDTLVAGMISFSRTTGLTRIVTDGELTPLTKAGEGGMHHFPVATPDGNKILFDLISGGHHALGVTTLSGEHVDTISLPSTNLGLPLGIFDHKLFYSIGQRAFSVGIDLARRRLLGRPVDLGEELPRYGAQLSRNGTLLYTRSSVRPVAIIVRNGVAADTIGRQLLAISSPRWSPDGQSIAVNSRSGESGVYVIDLKTGTAARITTGNNYIGPVWSLDGAHIAVNAGVDSATMWEARDGSTAPSLAAAIFHSGRITNITPSPDGHFVAMQAAIAGHDFIYVEAAGAPAREARRFATDAGFPTWSPDGKWVVYESDSAGRKRVIAQAYPSGGTVQLSEDVGAHPVWPRGSKVVYYESGRDIVGAQVEDVAGGLRVTSRHVYWTGASSSTRADSPFLNYDVSSRGDMVVIEPLSSDRRNEVVVEVNWAQAMAKKK